MKSQTEKDKQETMKLNNHHKTQESERQSLLCCCSPEWKASICLPDSDPTPSSNERWLEAGLMLGGPSSVQEPSLGTRLPWEHQQSASCCTTKFLAVGTVRGGAPPCYSQRLHTLGSACVCFFNRLSSMKSNKHKDCSWPWAAPGRENMNSLLPTVYPKSCCESDSQVQMELRGSSRTQKFATVNATVLHRDKKHLNSAHLSWEKLHVKSSSCPYLK